MEVKRSPACHQTFVPKFASEKVASEEERVPESIPDLPPGGRRFGRKGRKEERKKGSMNVRRQGGEGR